MLCCVVCGLIEPLLVQHFEVRAPLRIRFRPWTLGLSASGLFTSLGAVLVFVVTVAIAIAFAFTST